MEINMKHISIPVKLLLLIMSLSLGFSSLAQDETTIWFGAASTSLDPPYVPIFTLGRQILAEEGIRIEFVALPTDESVQAALDQGRIDVGFISTGGLSSSLSEGSSVQYVVGVMTQNPFVLVTGSDVEDLSELSGGVTAAHAQVSLSVAVAEAFFSNAGLAVGDDYEIVFMPGSSNRANALEAGLLDSAVIFGPVATELVNRSDGDYKIFGGTWDVLPPMLWEGIGMSEQFRTENEEVAISFVNAILQTYSDFYESDPAEMAELINDIPEDVEIELDILETEYSLYQEINLYPVDGGLNDEMYTQMVDWLVERGQLDEGDVVDFQTANDVMWIETAMEDE
jgi:ABC-type nitrate/sulfonate/bicarbonate transport system substrate-binding protein